MFIVYPVFQAQLFTQWLFRWQFWIYAVQLDTQHTPLHFHAQFGLRRLSSSDTWITASLALLLSWWIFFVKLCPLKMSTRPKPSTGGAKNATTCKTVYYSRCDAVICIKLGHFRPASIKRPVHGGDNMKWTECE